MGTSSDGELTPSDWALVELVEAAVCVKATDIASTALVRLAEQADASGTDWVRGPPRGPQARLSDESSARTSCS